MRRNLAMLVLVSSPFCQSIYLPRPGLVNPRLIVFLFVYLPLTPGPCEQMELDVKNSQLALAECRKITCVHAESGMKEYNEQNTAGSAAAAR